LNEIKIKGQHCFLVSGNSSELRAVAAFMAFFSAHSYAVYLLLLLLCFLSILRVYIFCHVFTVSL